MPQKHIKSRCFYPWLVTNDKQVRRFTFDWYGVAIPNFGFVWRPPYLPYRFRRPCSVMSLRY